MIACVHFNKKEENEVNVCASTDCINMGEGRGGGYTIYGGGGIMMLLYDGVTLFARYRRTPGSAGVTSSGGLA